MPRRDASLTVERLRELLSYDPLTGEFRNLVNRSANARAGEAVGTRHNAGYMCARIDGGLYLCHRLAWFYVHGVWPANQIDHIDGIRTNNRIANLRECTNAENCQNMRAHRDGTSAYAGVSLVSGKKSNCWTAQICVNGKQRNLGYFSSEAKALEARLAAKKTLHVFEPNQRSAK